MSYCVSIISHGHGGQVQRLLHKLAALPHAQPQDMPRRVVLTLNLPDPATADALRACDWPFALELVQGSAPLGFGANHNRAFALDGQAQACDFFAVLNPDVDWPEGSNPFAALRQALLAEGGRAGLAYPVQEDAQGRLQDHERLLPTPLRLLRRHLPGLRRREVPPGGQPDWVNAAFLLLPRRVYARLGGFDEGYHMYCEDVDLCLRLQGAGWRMVRAGDARVIHGAQRASRRQWQHLRWHLQSLWRLWHSPAWQQARARAQGRARP